MSLLSLTIQIFRAARHRRDVLSMTELDDRTLADIGLLRTDVYASLAKPLPIDPSRALKAACCHWRTSASGSRLSSETVACC